METVSNSATPAAAGSPAAIDADTCFRAYETRDERFDGRFFVAVKTTGIFCRPVCPARTPKRQNVEFHASAAAAFAAGFRPCLRCRPERAPRGIGAATPGAALVARALTAIDAGALDEGSLDRLASWIGVSTRHLRRLFETHLGVAPLAVAQARRLMFARQLIEETVLPLTEVAFAAGFASVRRFNSAISAAYRATPGSLRRPMVSAPSVASVGALVSLRLGPLAVDGFAVLTAFYRARAFGGVETVAPGRYARTLSLGAHSGSFEVCHNGHDLTLASAFPDHSRLPLIVARVKRMFDLGAPLAAITSHLACDPLLRPALASGAPRVPCAWDPYELALRAVLGQQVSVAAATTLAARLVERFGIAVDTGGSALRLLFPPPAAIAAAAVEDLTGLGIVRSRAACLITLARHIAGLADWRQSYAGLDAFAADLTALPGIGPWTAQYVAMRGFGDPDAFPAADLGLLRAARSLGLAHTARELQQHAERWRPWRAYAAQTLWNFNSKDAA